MNYSFFVICFMLFVAGCDSDPEDEKVDPYWKDVSLKNVYMNWKDIQMINENVGFIAGIPVCVSTYDTIPKNLDQIIADTIRYQVEEGIKIEPSNSDPILCKTTDGGDTWNPIKVPFISGIRQLCFINENTGYVSTDCEGVYKTIDGGTTWKKLLSNTIIGRNHYWSAKYNLCFINENEGFANMSNSNEWAIKTDDGGRTWTILNNIVGDYVYASEDVVISSNGYTLYKSIDNAETWTPLTTGTKIFDVCFLSSSHFYINTYNKILETTDTGINWKSYKSSFEYAPRILVRDNQAFIMESLTLNKLDLTTGTETIIKKLDGKQAFLNMEFLSGNRLLLVGTNGMILRYEQK